MPSVRLLPIVLFAAVSLLALKTLGILGGGGYILGGAETIGSAAGVQASNEAKPAAAPDGQSAPKRGAVGDGEGRRSWAQEVLGYPEITGSVGGGSKAPTASERPKEAPLPFESRQGAAPGEIAVLERLGERRQELDARGRELEIREGLLKAAEQRLEARMEELKGIEAQTETAGQRKSEADAARVKGLVTMYENMKAKDAARIFDRLEMRILLELATQINPRRMADILASMTPEAAERLTGELASRGGAGPKPATAAAELPKIEGKPRN